jgi:CRP/FNR family cyclic AMP-dependent transcriptional regulator
MWIEAAGYLAAALVFATFWMRTMIPLRALAIGSNFAFITYGVFNGLMPVLILHLILLPLNSFRGYEMLRLVRRVQEASRGDLTIDWLKPFAKAERYDAGHVLFQMGDYADRLFFIIRGEISLEEVGQHVGPGTLLGEIGLFAPDRSRTQTARCETAVELLSVSETELAQLCYQNPGLCFHLLRLITARLLQNANLAEASYRHRVLMSGG